MFASLLPPWLAWPTLIGLVTALPVGAGAWLMSHHEAARFEQAATQATQSLALRLHECDTRVLALAAWLGHAGPTADDAGWQRMEARLRLGLPGTCSGTVAFMPLLAPGDLAAHEAAQSVRLGRPYQVRPAGPRPWYAPIMRVAPDSASSRRLLGLDAWNDPEQRSALERARDTGRPAATGRVRRPLDGDAAQAVITQAPVYRQGLPLDSVAQRRTALYGFVGQWLRIDTVVAETAAEQPGLELALIDPLEESGAARPRATVDHPLRFGDHDWLLRAQPAAGSGALGAWQASPGWLLAGLLPGLLAAVASALLPRQRARARVSERQALAPLAGDISREQVLQAQATQAERLNALLLDAVPSALLLVDGEGTVMRCNPAACDLFGYPEAELIGLPMARLSDTGAAADPLAAQGLAQPRLLRSRRDASGRLVEMEWSMRRRDGSQVPVSMLAVAVNAATSPQDTRHADSTLVLLTDISERKRATAQIERLALHDSLTGLPNRLHLEERARRALQHAQQHDKGLALVLMDLDRFKQINDTLGHPVGDHLLQGVARSLSESVRSGDTVARMGGDEFVLLLVDVPAPADAMRVVEKVRDAFRGVELAVDGHHLRVTFSIGVALFPAHGTDLASLLRQADLAMYRAKAAGRDTALLFDPERHAANAARLGLETDLRRALRAGELRLHYQPVADNGTGCVTGLEALMRWQHPALGMIPPGDFIGIAEDTGEIVSIGAWALRQACADLARLRALWPGLRMAVNVSARQLLSHDLVHDVKAALDQAALPGQALDLEITESALMETHDHVLNKLATLRELGVGIAIDDFGTGYSSLAYLSSFPVTTLKVDRSFVSQIDSGQGQGLLAAAIVSLARGLGLETVAEGVETRAQWTYLREIGCGQVQGYLFSPAVPMERLPETLARIAALPLPEPMQRVELWHRTVSG
jgi:diguanylate cyclase (GGDEF)-like protein/PAS domain S-box-containing protein